MSSEERMPEIQGKNAIPQRIKILFICHGSTLSKPGNA